jgi:hypothetical protein
MRGYLIWVVLHFLPVETGSRAYFAVLLLLMALFCCLLYCWDFVKYDYVRTQDCHCFYHKNLSYVLGKNCF